VGYSASYAGYLNTKVFEAFADYLLSEGLRFYCELKVLDPMFTGGTPIWQLSQIVALADSDCHCQILYD